MAISLVASTSKVIGVNGPGTTAAIDTTGATAIVLSIAHNVNGVPTVTDSKGNTYTGLTTYKAPNSWQRLFYCLSPIVGAGHTITVNGSAIYATLWAAAFSGVGGYAGLENGATGSASPVATGSVTPTLNGSLVFTGLCGGGAGVTDTVPSGYTGLATVPFSAGNNYQNTSAYLIQTTAAATNPSWAWVGAARTEAAVSVAVFSPPGPTETRVTQDAIETLSLPTPAAVVSQTVVETLSSSTVLPLAPALVTQAVTEVLTLIPPPTETRVSQQVAELLVQSPPLASRVTQLAVDLWNGSAARTRSTQLAVEAFHPILVPLRSTQQPVELFDARAAALRVSQEPVEVFLVPRPRRLIRRLRRAPHVADEHRRIAYAKFALDLQRGVGALAGQGANPVVTLRVSRDGGQTWSEPVTMRAGTLGAYTTRVLARRLGQARDAVFEVTVSDPVAWSLVQAWLDLEPGTS